MNFKTYLGSVAILAAVISVPGSLHAGIYTTLASGEMSSNGSGPPLVDWDTMTSNGKTFTNTYRAASPGTTGLLRTVVATQVTTLKNGVNFTPIAGPNGGNVYAIAALDGTIDGGFGSTGPLATFTSGRLGFVESFPSFNPNDPSTWGLSLDAGGGPMGRDTVSGFFSEYVLGRQDFVTWNNGDTIFFDGSVVNTSSLDSAAFNEQTQGRFNFVEDSPAGLTPGDAFITTTPETIAVEGNPGPVNIPPIPTEEGLFLTTADVIEQNSRGSILGAFGTDSQKILNGLGIWGVGSEITGAGSNDGFANWGSGGVDDFIPVFANGINLSGDFRATNDTNSRPTAQGIVPEPASICIWAATGLLGLPLLRRRRRK